MTSIDHRDFPTRTFTHLHRGIIPAGGQQAPIRGIGEIGDRSSMCFCAPHKAPRNHLSDVEVEVAIPGGPCKVTTIGRSGNSRRSCVSCSVLSHARVIGGVIDEACTVSPCCKILPIRRPGQALIVTPGMRTGTDGLTSHRFPDPHFLIIETA